MLGDVRVRSATNESYGGVIRPRSVDLRGERGRQEATNTGQIEVKQLLTRGYKKKKKKDPEAVHS